MGEASLCKETATAATISTAPTSSTPPGSPVSSRTLCRDSLAGASVMSAGTDAGTVISFAQSYERSAIARLSTPRAREAMERVGIRLDELEARPLEAFKQVGITDAVVRRRFEHHEKRRQEKLHTVLAARAQVLADYIRNPPGRQQAESLLRLEEHILDEEGKRLRRGLKKQKHAQRSAEQLSAVQEQKEANLKAKVDYVDERVSAARDALQRRADRVREAAEMRKMATDAQKRALTMQHEAKAASYVAHQMDDELRRQRLEEERDFAHEKRQSAWAERRRTMERRFELNELEQEVKAQQALERYRDKVEVIERRKEEQAVQQQLAHEDRSLKQQDARERAERLERVERHKRDQRRRELDAQLSRADTMETLKAQMLERRAARSRKLSAQMAGRPQTSDTPGPGNYGVGPSCLNDHPGPRFTGRTQTVIPGSIDFAVRRAQSLPPPGTYDPRCLPRGDGALWGQKRGSRYGSIPRGPRHVPEKVAPTPGPGAYETNVSTVELEHSTRLQPPARPRSWIPSTDGPGPAAYAVDPFARKARLQKPELRPEVLAALP